MARTPKKAAGKPASKKKQPAKPVAPEQTAEQAAEQTAEQAAGQGVAAQTPEAAGPAAGGPAAGGLAAGGLPEGLSLGTSEPQKRGIIGWIFFVLLLPLWPIRRLLRPWTSKWFGPLPMRFGPPPIDHSEPDFDSEEPGMLAGQVIFVLITAFFVIAFFWASTAELDEQVRAEGEVIPPTDVQIIQARLPGVVTEIGVQLGSRVATGDILFRMEDEDVQANFADNEIIIASSRAALVRLEAEASGQESIRFPDELVAAAPQAVAEENSLFSQRRIALLGELGVLVQKVDTLERSIEEKEAAARLASERALIQKKEYDLIKPLVDAGHEPRLKLIEAEASWRQSEGEAELAALSIVSMQSDLSAKHKEIESVKQKYRAEASRQLVEMQTKLAQARSRQEALAGKVGYAEIAAQQPGVISALHLKTVGAVVQQGTVLAELVPDSTKATIRARLLPQDVADVKVGQAVRISLAAYDVSRYGAVEGVVTRIASNTTQQENMPPFYETLIEIPDLSFPRSPIKPDLVPGMQATIDILGGKRTVMDYILTPIQKASRAAFREK